jgi:hypothetical protein
MAELSVPEVHRGPLLRLQELAENEPDRLVEAVGDLDAFSPVPALAARLHDVSPDLTSLDSNGIALALVSLAAQQWRWGSDELGRLLSESRDLGIPEEGRESFSRVIHDLVELEVLKTMARALDVMSQQEHVFQNARILTDVRPIFGEDASAGPSGAVVIQTLRLEHFTDGRVQSINVSLDRQDLHDLQSVVDRAVEKGRSLRDVVARAGLPQFELRIDDDADA